MLSRRHLLASTAALLGALPLRARAAGTDRKFVFLLAPGGWDPTRVFVPAFDNAAVAMEADAAAATTGGLVWVDHPGRPAVRAFFEAWHDRMAVVNGLLVRSIVHDASRLILLTGDESGVSADWPARIGDATRDRFVLPHLVVGGLSYPGDRGTAVVRTGSWGQLEALSSGDAALWPDAAVGRPGRAAESLVDAWVTRRAGAVASRGSLEAAFALAHDKALALKELQYGVRLSASTLLADQAAVACDVLSRGLARCVTLGAGADVLAWDTHSDNDGQQSDLWEELFVGLGQLLALLSLTPGETEATLLDETVVVVLSEMGRSPGLNSAYGKDHWPYTSALVMGPGVAGGRVLGGFDERFLGEPLDPATGEASDAGEVPTAESLGAALLALADLDPGEALPGVTPLMGLLG